MSHIHVSHLGKTFKQYKKQPGFVGSLKSLVKRDHFDVHAVKDISFDIAEGELIGFIGPNGAGKT
ncbi:ATP-binding cassette domain-containing protein, partial [Candidatus Microgenomates bacterium]|nr:ATP-binding cassette domain-containing protein [Candidatus Microgenomates bacterium]